MGEGALRCAAETPLFCRARSIAGVATVAEALNQVPAISLQVRAIGWSLVVEQMTSIDFYEDTPAFAIVDNYSDCR